MDRVHIFKYYIIVHERKLPACDWVWNSKKEYDNSQAYLAMSRLVLPGDLGVVQGQPAADKVKQGPLHEVQ